VQFKEAAAMLQAAFTPLVTRAAAPCDAHLIVAAEDPSSIVSILLDKQADLQATAIVVAPHSQGGGLAEWWLGSVTKGLLAHSPVPVVVVPLGKS
jgi:nucleotide-binding universal stress UspA family protein